MLTYSFVYLNNNTKCSWKSTVLKYQYWMCNKNDDKLFITIVSYKNNCVYTKANIIWYNEFISLSFYVNWLPIKLCAFITHIDVEIKLIYTTKTALNINMTSYFSGSVCCCVDSSKIVLPTMQRKLRIVKCVNIFKIITSVTSIINSNFWFLCINHLLGYFCWRPGHSKWVPFDSDMSFSRNGYCTS